MTNNATLNSADLIQVGSKGTLSTNTLQVAKAFRLSHRKVLRKLEKLPCTETFLETHFWQYHCALEKNGHKNKETSSACSMSRDGFFLLASTFKGSQSTIIREAFLTAFAAKDNDINQLTAKTIVDGRFLLTVTKGQVDHLYKLDGMTIVNAERCRTIRNNLQALARQMQLFEGGQDLDVLDVPLESLPDELSA